MWYQWHLGCICCQPEMGPKLCPKMDFLGYPGYDLKINFILPARQTSLHLLLGSLTLDYQVTLWLLHKIFIIYQIHDLWILALSSDLQRKIFLRTFQNVLWGLCLDPVVDSLAHVFRPKSLVFTFFPFDVPMQMDAFCLFYFLPCLFEACYLFSMF